MPELGDQPATLPPLLVHSAESLTETQPWPLQAFMPLQLDVAVLQALVPLHELAPAHFTVDCACETLAIVPAANIAAAAAAITAAVLVVI
jgi:hypothetical protein